MDKERQAMAKVVRLETTVEMLLHDLAGLMSGEVCDHAVGICWCGIRIDMVEAGREIPLSKVPAEVARLIEAEDAEMAAAEYEPEAWVDRCSRHCGWCGACS